MSGYIGTQPVPQATQTRDVFTATSGQTSFATSGYTPNFLDVWLNGVKLVNGDDFTATNGSDVVLTSGATAGDTVEVLSYSTYEVNAQTYTGGLTINNDAATVLTVDRATSDGTLVDFKKDGASVGGIGTIYGSTFLDGASAKSGVYFGSTNVTPRYNGSDSNGAVDLGAGLYRWKDLYLSGGVYLGGTGAANLLDDYEEGTWTPTWSVGGTITVNNATYVKVGTLCTLFFDLVFPAASDTNTAYTSIPFTFSLSSYASGTLLYTNNSSFKPMECQVSGPGLAFRTNQLSTISYANMAGYRVIGSVTYKTT